MWALDPSKNGVGRGRKEADLARYFKLEYGETEVDRLLAQARAARHSSPGRFWTRLRQRVARQRENGGHGASPRGPAVQPKAVASASISSKEPAPIVDAAPETLPTECRHPEWETLGSGGSATYLQCRTCGALVVSQGGQLWSFGRDRAEGI